jgi:hypothetical protein
MFVSQVTCEKNRENSNICHPVLYPDHSRMNTSFTNVFLLSEAQPKNALVNPPPHTNLEMIARLQTFKRARTYQSTRRARCYNFTYNFTFYTILGIIFKLRSTAEQLPALVSSQNDPIRKSSRESGIFGLEKGRNPFTP